LATIRNTRSRYVRILSILIAVTLLACVAIGVYYWNNTVWSIAFSQRDQTLREYRKAGLPWTADELKLGAPKEATNAGPLIKRSETNYRAARERSKFESLSASISNFYKKRDIAGLKASIAPLKVHLAEARRIGRCGYADFDRDYDRGGWLLFPEYVHIKRLVKLLVAESLLEAAEGSFGAAISDIECAIDVSMLTANEPVLLGPLVSISCYTISYRGVETLAELMRDDKEALLKLASVIESRKPKFSISRSLQGEAYLGVAVTRNLKNVIPISDEQKIEDWKPIRESEKQPKDLIRNGFPEDRIARAYVVRHMQTFKRFAGEAKNTSDILALGAGFDRYIESLDDMDRSYAFSKLITPIFYPCFAAILQCYANYEVQLGLVKTLIFRAKNGRYPTSLAEAGYQGTDPFTGQPLKYSATATGCKIYCLGVDKADQNGLRRQERTKTKDDYSGYDIVASYPAYRPKK